MEESERAKGQIQPPWPRFPSPLPQAFALNGKGSDTGPQRLSEKPVRSFPDQQHAPPVLPGLEPGTHAPGLGTP